MVTVAMLAYGSDTDNAILPGLGACHTEFIVSYCKKSKYCMPRDGFSRICRPAPAALTCQTVLLPHRGCSLFISIFGERGGSLGGKIGSIIAVTAGAVLRLCHSHEEDME